jgi:hypothetical protein
MIAQTCIPAFCTFINQRCGTALHHPLLSVAQRNGWGDAMKADYAKLRELAAWYREQAERAGNPVIWEARLRTAEELDEEADRIEGKSRVNPGFW